MERRDGAMTQQHEAVTNQAAKIVGIWAAIGITSWAEAASFLAFVLSALALGEYIWKKVVRRLLERTGYVQPKRRKIVEVEDE